MTSERDAVGSSAVRVLTAAFHARRARSLGRGSFCLVDEAAVSSEARLELCV